MWERLREILAKQSFSWQQIYTKYFQKAAKMVLDTIQLLVIS